MPAAVGCVYSRKRGVLYVRYGAMQWAELNLWGGRYGYPIHVLTPPFIPHKNRDNDRVMLGKKVVTAARWSPQVPQRIENTMLPCIKRGLRIRHLYIIIGRYKLTRTPSKGTNAFVSTKKNTQSSMRRRIDYSREPVIFSRIDRGHGQLVRRFCFDANCGTLT